MELSKGFIRYQTRKDKNSNIEYATFCKAKRINGKKINETVWLGRVIDKNKGRYFTKK
jgi:hypothetical protein